MLLYSKYHTMKQYSKYHTMKQYSKKTWEINDQNNVSKNQINQKINHLKERNKTKCNILVTLTMTSFLASCKTQPQKQRYSITPTKKIRKNTYKIKGNTYISKEALQMINFYEKWGKNPYHPKGPPITKKGKWYFEPVPYTRTDIKEYSTQFNKEVRGRNRLFLFSFLLMLSPVLLAL